MGKHTLIRSSSVISLAIIITLGLFFFMTTLIGKTPDAPKSVPNGPITISMTEVVQDPIDKVRPQPKPHEPLPKVVKSLGKTPSEPKLPIITEHQKIDLPATPKVTGEDYNIITGNKSATPMVQIQPQYPIDAARNGKEGWVVVKYDIDNKGMVVNAEVIDADPKRTFDKAALRAIKKWKYKPKTEEGITVAQNNQQVKLDFKLDN